MAAMTTEHPVSAADAGVSELYATHWHALVRLAYLMVHDVTLAEDLVQDALIGVHQRWGRLRDSHAALAYVRRSVVNGARSALRHQVVVDRYAQRTGAEESVVSAEHSAMEHAEHDAMLQALSQLSDKQREVLILRYYSDLSEADIADTLEISRGAVKTHAHRGLARLRTILEDTSATTYRSGE
ncbi:MAG: SigE family RNA polymerase sigma factor [Actinomycetales bacterium]|nr:SigE family RNA polymerase sigma factor [Tetrasphaera sp.]NLW98744.1 SigE family RNA polymerase sigma factor [Actinomycetales bacterium]